MNRIERISVARIMSDLIKSDMVVDAREMALFDKAQIRYNITKDDLADMRHITFANAVNNLLCLTHEEKSKLLNVFEEITLADGRCNKDEALLMMALLYAFEGIYDSEMIHVQVPQQGLQLENSQIIYVESEFDEEVNRAIAKNFYQIENAMRLAGFEFAYIPKIVEVYRNTDSELFNNVMTFLMYGYSGSQLDSLQQVISSLTTTSFCHDLLCNKLKMPGLADIEPSLLVKVGETVADNFIYANFLRMTLRSDIIDEIKQFIFRFTSMLNAEYSIVKNIYNDVDRFIYKGIYKEIIDLCLMRDNCTNSILLNHINGQILFEPTNERLNVHRAEKALYTLFLIESLTGGVRMSMPECGNYKNHKRNLEKVQKKFEIIYKWFGGGDNIPDITSEDIYRPKIARIRGALSRLIPPLISDEDYMIRLIDGTYRVNLDHNMVFCTEIESGRTPLQKSELFRRVSNV